MFFIQTAIAKFSKDLAQLKCQIEMIYCNQECILI